jgi:tetratricopeptide (TPR) repeat protein
VSFEAEIEELQRRGDAVALARRWLARAIETGDPAMCGAAARAVAGRTDDESRTVAGDAAAWAGEHHFEREAFARAAEAFERALAAYRGIAPERVAVCANRLSRARFVLGRHDDAIAAAEEAFAHAGRNVDQLATAHINRGNALNGLERYGDARTWFERALAIEELAADRSDPRRRCLLAMAHLGRAAGLIDQAKPEARAEVAAAIAVLDGVQHQPEVLRVLGRCHFTMTILAYTGQRFEETPIEARRTPEFRARLEETFLEARRTIDFLARIPSPPPGVDGEIGRIRTYLAHAWLQLLEFRAGYVELAGSMRLLERSAAVTGSAAFAELVAQQRELIDLLARAALENDPERVSPSARCAFCGCSAMSRRRMIPGIGTAVICSGCYPRALEDVEARSPRDPRTKLRAGTPRFRKGVQCDFCGEGYRRQFIVADEHKICDECLDACADVR